MNAVLSPSESATPSETPNSASDWRFKRLGLSRQESRVIELAMEGRIDKQIAVEIGISLGTVRVYWKRLRFKTGGTRSEAIAKLAKQSLQLDYDELQQRADHLQNRLDLQGGTESRLVAMEALFANVAFPVAVVDGQTAEVVFANESFAALSGHHADDSADALAFADVDLARSILKKSTLKPRKCSIELRTQDGETPPIEFNICGEPGAFSVLWQTP